MSENRDGTLVPPSYTPESPVSLEYKKVVLKSHLCSINGSEQAVASVVPGSDSGGGSAQKFKKSTIQNVGIQIFS